MLAYLPVDAPTSGTDLTQIFVTLIVTSGVIVTAVFGYLANRAGKAAKVAAEQTQVSNSNDHGRVADALTALKDAVTHLDGRVQDVGHNVGVLRDQFIDHLQHHVDKENPT